MAQRTVPDKAALRESARSMREPPPSAQECARSERLVRYIRNEIDAAGGSIDFAHYMGLSLYAPGLGYYRGGAPKFGTHGDFTTAPELSPLFARCIARQCQEVFAQLGRGDVMEAGAGSGTLAVGLLRELEALECVPDNYFILELSAELQQRQCALIDLELPHLVEHVHWLQSLPDDPLTGVIVANELLDAMPVHRFRVSERGIEQMHVAWESDHFIWHPKPADDIVRERAQALALPTPYISEINLQAEAWVRSMGAHLRRGVLLLIDYGFPRTEYYHPQRDEGTLMCHYRHRNHGDPLILTGLQDITAHVDFTAVAEAGVSGGLSLLGYTSQAGFLLATGLEKFIAASDPNARRQHIELVQQVNKLTSPAEMGELYKVIALGRGVETPLQGFTLQDRRGRL